MRDLGLRLPYRTWLVGILALALLAAAYVCVVRLKIEAQTRRVEIAMDFGDFNALARSYGYDPAAFLVSLRRAGLTSLAVTEELGANVNATKGAIATSGQALIDSARLSPLSDPALAALVRGKRVVADEVYLIVYDAATYARYRAQLALHVSPATVHVLHATLPFVLALKTQPDFFNTLGLGIPDDQRALAKKLGLLLVPRVQNDERLSAAQIDGIFDGFDRHQRVSTVIFFGLRNQVLGFPDHLEDTAAAFRRTHLNFGSIETYDRNQVQKGNDGLARLIPGQSVRVQAISKVELDKLDFETIVARYLLGVRERNVRVVYVRPFAHEHNKASIEQTNVELVRRIAEGLRVRGFTLGRATPVFAFRVNPVVVAAITLAVPALLLLLLDLFGRRSTRLAYVLFALDLLLYLGLAAVHHETLARKVLALAGAMLFAVAAFVAVAPAFRARARATYAGALRAGLRAVLVATIVALGGAVFVGALLATPLFMEEIERFTGVKAIIVIPPLVALALYLYTDRFGANLDETRAVAFAPVRLYQLLVGALLFAAAVLYISRSGNQSDIAPSAFELSLRSGLTALLTVRPRFKEFLIGFPLLMLLPSLVPSHQRAAGWLFALGIGIGTADIIDTFSHIHTPLLVSLLRLLNAGAIGCLIGAFALAVYRFAMRRAATVPQAR